MITTQLFSEFIKLCNLWRILGAASWNVLSVRTRVPRVHGGIKSQIWNYHEIVDRSSPGCSPNRSKVCGGE